MNENVCREMTLKEEIEDLMIDEVTKQRMLEKLKRIDERFYECEKAANEIRKENGNLFDKIHYYRGALILLAREFPPRLN